MTPYQYNLASLLCLITVICAVLALVVKPNPFVQMVAGAVIGANVLGAVAALFVTHAMGFPRDGSLRNKEEKHD
jgi:membrane protein YdbS with pleckstrin-like domain